MTPPNFRWLGLIAVVALALGCAEDLDYPDPPNMQATVDKYERPTAAFQKTTAREFIEQYLARRKELEEVDYFRPLTEPVEDFAQRTSTTEDGTIKFDDAPVRADALITLSGRCPGWNGESTDERGRFLNRMTVRDSQIIPVMWGEVSACRYRLSARETTVDVEVSGEIEIFFPSLADPDDPTALLFRFDFDEYTVDQTSRTDGSGSFRTIGDRLEILVEDDLGSSAVLFGAPEAVEIGVRAGNGTWSCHLEDQTCTSETTSSSFSY